jgi:hypothetical protein
LAKSKECAERAEKVVTEWDRDGLSRGFPKTIWSNHYSPKFNRCFIEVIASSPARTESLTDAFERSTLAVEDVVHQYCKIELEDVACPKVSDFISSHMKD